MSNVPAPPRAATRLAALHAALRAIAALVMLGACLLPARGWAAATAQAEPALHIPASGRTGSGAVPTPAARTTVIEDGRQCTVIDFEGVGDLAAIPVFDGISSPGWLGIIDADAGGSGNFAQEPSPQTIAFWLGGNPGSRDIVLANKASRIQFHYASFVGVTMQALDEAGAVLATSNGAPNFNLGTGDPTGQFNRWDPLSVQTDGNQIKTVRVSGNTNQTGIDNLKVCSTIGVAAVEMTQAIQQYQDLPDLKASLAGTREPPVPVVAGKPGVLRLYMNKVDAVTTVSVRLTGQISQTRTVTLQPQCQPEDQRRRRNGCRSIDFFFTPPSGNWDVNIKVLDPRAAVLEEHDLPFRSRDTDRLLLKGVTVCDAQTAAGVWQCAPASALNGKTTVLRKLAPTRQVSVATTASIIRRATAGYPAPANWWVAAVKDANDLFGIFDRVAGAFGEHRTYFGMVRTAVPGGIGGIAHGIPSHAALGRTSAIRLGSETVQEVIAHETGHTLGLRHTNVLAPAAAAAPPGCYNLAVDAATDWPFANNRIQSNARLEVGFDVAANLPVQPENNFDILSYCVPRWISPLRYKRALTGLGGGAVAGASFAGRGGDEAGAIAMPHAVADGPFWTVSGVIANGAVLFDPLFDDVTRGPNDAGEGDYRIEVRDRGGAVLFARAFTPSVAQVESRDDDVAGPPAFHELVPVQAAAAAIAVVDPAGSTLGVVALGGARPNVTLLQPAGGTLAGLQDIRWSVTDADSTRFVSKVLYSADMGASWAQLGLIEDVPALKADFDALPGGLGTVLLKVVVSDGANTGSVLSAPLTVPKKTPQDVAVVQPADGTAFVAQGLVEFEGMAFDVDDGVLDGDAISWTSSLDGPLGTGAVLGVTSLRKGSHLVTMRAADSDGNAATAMVTVHVAGDAPGLDLQVQPLDTLPATCVEATITATPDPGGVPLALVEYSLDGGVGWTGVPLNRLPFKFRLPGSGYFHLIARAFDTAGQVTARDAKFFADSACAESGPPRIDGVLAGQAVVSPGVLMTEIRLTNTGKGRASNVVLAAITARTLAGSGNVVYDAAGSPLLPLALPDLAPGASALVRVQWNAPPGVRRFGITETGSLQDRFGRTLRFSINQAVTPSP